MGIIHQGNHSRPPLTDAFPNSDRPLWAFSAENTPAKVAKRSTAASARITGY